MDDEAVRWRTRYLSWTRTTTTITFQLHDVECRIAEEQQRRHQPPHQRNDKPISTNRSHPSSLPPQIAMPRRLHDQLEHHHYVRQTSSNLPSIHPLHSSRLPLPALPPLRNPPSSVKEPRCATTTIRCSSAPRPDLVLNPSPLPLAKLRLNEQARYSRDPSPSPPRPLDLVPLQYQYRRALRLEVVPSPLRLARVLGVLEPAPSSPTNPSFSQLPPRERSTQQDGTCRIALARLPFRRKSASPPLRTSIQPLELISSLSIPSLRPSLLPFDQVRSLPSSFALDQVRSLPLFSPPGQARSHPPFSPLAQAPSRPQRPRKLPRQTNAPERQRRISRSTVFSLPLLRGNAQDQPLPARIEAVSLGAYQRHRDPFKCRNWSGREKGRSGWYR